MPEQDPFSNAAFLDRLAKLLPLLASAQAGEADSARRRLIEHLAHHRLSLTDLANQLQTLSRRNNAGPDSLRRDLQGVRQAWHMAEERARYATEQSMVLSQRANQAEAYVQQLLVERSRVRIVAAGSIVTALSALGMLAFMLWSSPFAGPESRQSAAVVSGPLTARYGDADAVPAPPDADMLARTAVVAVADAAVRGGTSPAAPVRFHLPRNAAVAIVGYVLQPGGSLALIRTPAGLGFLPAAELKTRP